MTDKMKNKLKQTVIFLIALMIVASLLLCACNPFGKPSTDPRQTAAPILFLLP